jgi:hypothetical protein
MKEWLIRVKYVIECKWTKGKPWIIFADRHHGISPITAIAQTPSNYLGDSCLLMLAKEESLHELHRFKCPDVRGFGGVRALTGDGQNREDVFFNTAKGIIDGAQWLASYYDYHMPPPPKMPDSAVIVFPVIVIDGELFEASYQESSGESMTNQVSASRLYWKGSTQRHLYNVIDIVVADHLDSYIELQSRDSVVLYEALRGVWQQIAEAFRTQDLTRIRNELAARGMSALPPLLADLAHNSRPAK